MLTPRNGTPPPCDGERAPLGPEFEAAGGPRRGRRPGADLLQTTLLAAIEQADKLVTARDAGPWLRAVLRNRAIELQRSRARPIEPERRARMEARAAGDEAADREITSLVGERCQRLGEPYRSLVPLHLLDRLSAQEIAARTGASPATVASAGSRKDRPISNLPPWMHETATGPLEVLLGRQLRSMVECNQEEQLDDVLWLGVVRLIHTAIEDDPRIDSVTVLLAKQLRSKSPPSPVRAWLELLDRRRR